MSGDIWISTKDLFQIISTNRRWIQKWALILSLLALAYTLLCPVRYRAEASFKDKGKGHGSMDHNMVAMALMNSGGNDSEGSFAFKSARVVRPVVQKLGLQVSYSPSWSPFCLLGRIPANLYTAWAHFNSYEEPIFTDIEQTLVFRNVHYLGDHRTSFFLTFTSDHEFEVEGIKGQVNHTFHFQEIEFTLLNPDKHLSGRTFHVSLRPIEPTVESTIGSLRAEVDKKDKTLVKLEFVHPDRLTAASIVNELMESYHNYLAQEGQRLSDIQIAYLKRRETESIHSLEDVMKEHAHLVSNDLSTFGFSDSEKAMHFFTRQQEGLQTKLYALELEKRRLQEALQQEAFDFDRLASIPEFHEALRTFFDLKAKKDQLLFSLGEHVDLRSSQDFEGIDLSIAADLLVRYLGQLEGVQAEIGQFRYLLEQARDESVEVSSIAGSLQDHVGRDIALKAAALEVAVRDPHNRSVKEQERGYDELSLQRLYLQVHLEQGSELLTLKESLLREKIRNLQNASLGIVYRQLDLLEKQVRDQIESRLAGLHLEAELLQEEVVELCAKMGSFPQKWVSEQILKQRIQMAQMTSNELTRLVENKNVSANIDLVQSSPIDTARPPTLPQSPRPLLFILLGAFVGTFGTISFFLGKAVIYGVPASQENLRLSGQLVAGKLTRSGATLPLSLLYDQDLATLRNIASEVLNSANRTLLFNCPLYSEKLAQLISLRGLNVLHVDLDRVADGSLYDYLTHKEHQARIVRKDSFDQISGGIHSRHGLELLLTDRFKTLLATLHQQYPLIIVSTARQPDDPSLTIIGPLFDRMVVMIEKQTLQQVHHLFGKVIFVLKE